MRQHLQTLSWGFNRCVPGSAAERCSKMWVWDYPVSTLHADPHRLTKQTRQSEDGTLQGIMHSSCAGGQPQGACCSRKLAAWPGGRGHAGPTGAWMEAKQAGLTPLDTPGLLNTLSGFHDSLRCRSTLLPGASARPAACSVVSVLIQPASWGAGRQCSVPAHGPAPLELSSCL